MVDVLTGVEPECAECGSYMVHCNETDDQGRDRFDCAAAYFTLADDGILDDTGGMGLRYADDELSEFHRETAEHWRRTRAWVALTPPRPSRCPACRATHPRDRRPIGVVTRDDPRHGRDGFLRCDDGWHTA